MKHTVKLSQAFKKHLVKAVAGLTAFSTSYALILPAITMDQETAEEDPGIVFTEEENVNAMDTYTEIETAEETVEEAVEETIVETAQEETTSSEPSVVQEPQEESVPASQTTEENAEPQVEEETPLQHVANTLEYESKDDYRIVVKYDASFGLTEKAELEVKEVIKKDDYTNYLEAFKKQYGNKEDAYRITYARFFNVNFSDNGAYTEVTGKTENTFTFAEASEIKEDEELKVLFIDKDGYYQEYDEKENKVSFTYAEVNKVKEISFEDKKGLNNFAIIVMKNNEERQEENTEPAEETTIEEAPVEIPEEVVEETEAEESVVIAEEEENNYTAGTLTSEGKGYSVTLTYNEDAQIEEGSRLFVREIIEDSKTHNEYLEEAQGKVENISYARFFDITILDKEGNEYEPKASVDVKITIKDAPAADEVKAVHFTEEKTEVIDTETNEEEVSFTAESFSVYGVVYTVDFHYEVNGKMFDFSIPGGGFVSLYNLVKVLGIETDDTNTEKDEIQELVDGVENIIFSNPELVSVSKVDEDTTAGAIKDKLGLACEYSAELKEEQIAEINAQEIKGGDWSLISVKPFTSEETLTVTMKNGDQWTLKVTDAQILKDYLSADGNTYHIEVTLDENEIISGNIELSVNEILPEADRYEDYLYSASEYMFLESVEDISFARFFDIKIIKDGEKYEPMYPVQIKITYQDAIDLAEDQQVSIVHFAHSGPEVIQAVEVNEDGNEVTYEQNGFSVSGTVVTNASNIISGGEYVIYTQSGSNYYAISHSSEGRDNDTVHPVKLDRGSTINNGTISAQAAGNNIVWTVTKVGNNYRFSFEAGGNTYYLRTYGGVMVGADSDINESGYWESNRYTWTYDNNRRLRTVSNNNNNNRYLGYSNNVIKERVNNNSNAFYFARVTNVSDVTPRIHYVDENENELTVVNGRNWGVDSETSPAYLIYDIDGYEYVKTTIKSVNGTQIRPILRQRVAWQYTTSTGTGSVTWTDIPVDTQDSGRLEDIYVVYKKATEPVMGGIPKVKESSSTEDPVEPGILKTSKPNGDGTNTIGLNITADTSPLEVEKLADVIVIFDVSTSMRREMAKDTQHNNNNTTAANCDHSTRLWIAHNAVKDLAETLIGDNTNFQDSAGNKLIRMSLISFSDKAALVQDFTDNYRTYASAVEGLKANQGTNWEDALRMANSMAVDPERATFVIFVTDGNPSYRATRGNLVNMAGYPDTVNDNNIDIYSNNTYYMYRANTIFGGLDETDERNYNTTLDVAKSMVDHNKNYYAIGVGPASGVTRLKGLTTYAYGMDTTKGEERTKNATDSDELSQAFNEIAASIVALLGWGDITMTDGITSLANTVEKCHLVNVEGNFTYWKADAPEGWGTWSKNVRAGYILGTTGKELTYPEDYSSWTNSEKTKYVNAYNKGKNLSEDDFTSWNPATENCNEAEYDEESGSVVWDMGHRFVPEAGCTYRVSFIVWPSQEAYDILAKCKNDQAFYDTLTDEQKAQIIRTGTSPNYSYTLKTNDKDPRTTFTDARKTGDSVETGNETKTLKFNEVPDLNLASHTISVKKEWNNELNDGREPAPVTLGVRALGMDDPDTAGIDESIFSIIHVSESTSWGGSSNISTGLMKVVNGVKTVYEHGHDFTLTEDVDADARYHWELTADTYRPMVITDASKGYNVPTTVMLKKVTSSDSYDYVIDDGYYKIQSGTAVLTATNNRRSNLNLVKQVINSEGETVSSTQLFEFTIKIDDPTISESSASDQDIWFSVQTDKDDESTVVKDLIVEGASPEMKDGSHTGFFHVRDNTAFKVKIQPGWNLRVTNLPSKTTYTITETTISGFTFNTAFVDNGGTFTLTEGTTTGNGVIDEANKQYTVTYKNVTITKNVSIWKTDLGHNTITTGATFELYSIENYDDAAGTPKEGAEPVITGTTGTNGILTLGAIPVGEYRLVETEAPAGYNPASSAIKIFVSENNVTAMQGTSYAEVAQDVEGNPYRQYWVQGQKEGTYQIRVWNNPGVELPNTGGSGTTMIYFLGMMLIGLASAGLIMKHRKEAA